LPLPVIQIWPFNSQPVTLLPELPRLYIGMVQTADQDTWNGIWLVVYRSCLNWRI